MSKIYCLEFKKYTENNNLKVSHNSDGRIMFPARCIVGIRKKNKFIKNKKQKGCEIRIIRSEIPLPGDILL